MKQFIVFILATLFLAACGSPSGGNTSSSETAPSVEKKTIADDKGIGEVKNVKLNDPLDANMIASGKGIYELKCAACHKLSSQRVVGPGWAGVTERRTPEWIMNMTLNVDVMLEKDPVAREMLKECLVKMPNQNLSREDARNVLEFMYENDVKE